MPPPSPKLKSQRGLRSPNVSALATDDSVERPATVTMIRNIFLMCTLTVWTRPNSSAMKHLRQYNRPEGMRKQSAATVAHFNAHHFGVMCTDCCAEPSDSDRE